MWPKLRLSLLATLSSVFLFWWVWISSAFEEEVIFEVSAYYSAEPGQSYYYNGTYEREIKVNGRWTNGASWAEVFMWMVAAPKKYPFWTKIYLEWIGVIEVQDRGCGIVAAWEEACYGVSPDNDRLDLWMWHGEDAVYRSKSWGRKKIKGKIVLPSTPVSLDFWESEIGVLQKLEVNPESSKESDVKKLQIVFTNAELYDGEIDGNYESIKNELIDFQLKAGIIWSKTDEAAWWYGPKTLALLREKYWSKSTGLVEKSTSDYVNQSANLPEKYKIFLDYWDIELKPDSSSEEIWEFQTFLYKVWIYKWAIDGKYSSMEDDYIDFQIELWIIKSSKSWWAWYYGDKSKQVVGRYFSESEVSPAIIVEQQTLTINEKIALSKAVNSLKDKLSKREASWWASASSTLNYLDKQISNLLKKTSDYKLREKLLFIQQLIR